MRWGLLAAGWAGLFAALHVFWALGGSTGLASSAGDQLAAERPGWFVALGLWGVAVLLVIGACLGIALARPARPGRLRRVLVVIGTTVGVLLLLRGLGIQLLLLAGAYDENAAMTADQRRWSLLVWNPWFVAGGVAFVLAARDVGSRASSPEQ
jgi:hypothetical protein